MTPTSSIHNPSTNTAPHTNTSPYHIGDIQINNETNNNASALNSHHHPTTSNNTPSNASAKHWGIDQNNVTDGINYIKYIKDGSNNKKLSSDARRNGNRLLEVKHITLKTPQGRVLLRDLSFCIERHVNVLVQGPNGAGKSTLLRCLAGLRPVFEGSVYYNISNMASHSLQYLQNQQYDMHQQSFANKVTLPPILSFADLVALNTEDNVPLKQSNIDNNKVPSSQKEIKSQTQTQTQKQTHSKAESNFIYYLPQRPYMTTGSLREQVIYPLQQRTYSKWLLHHKKMGHYNNHHHHQQHQYQHRNRRSGNSTVRTLFQPSELQQEQDRTRENNDIDAEEEEESNFNDKAENEDALSEEEFLAAKEQLDAQICSILQKVRLGNLVNDLECGLDTEADWTEVLSGGEIQRLSIARLFYHQPALAILDESTSAVSEETEDVLYRECLNLGITLLTVSHRNQLRKHHQYVLHLNGDEQGSYSIYPT